MKILDGSEISACFDSEDEKEIKELIKKSNPSTDSNLSFIKINEESGWAYLTAKINDYEFSINYSSCMFDASYLIKFFEEIIKLKEELVLTLDYEGSYPILYTAPIDENNIRFLFAHDYNLFLNDDIDEYTISDYKIECDIVINKKELLEKIYNILCPFTENYNLKDSYYPVFNLENGKKYLKTIKKYMSKD